MVGWGRCPQWDGDGARSGTGMEPMVGQGWCPWWDRDGARSGTGLPASLLGGGGAPHTSSLPREAVFIH